MRGLFQTVLRILYIAFKVLQEKRIQEVTAIAECDFNRAYTMCA